MFWILVHYDCILFLMLFEFGHLGVLFSVLCVPLTCSHRESILDSDSIFLKTFLLALTLLQAQVEDSVLLC